MDDYTLPECSPEFLRVLKNIFDVRRMVTRADVTLEYLRGVQSVLDAIENSNNNYKEDEDYH